VTAKGLRIAGVIHLALRTAASRAAQLHARQHTRMKPHPPTGGTETMIVYNPVSAVGGHASGLNLGFDLQERVFGW
jgi:hypothetical protein